MKCSNCGNDISRGEKFCRVCGSKVSNNGLAIASVVLGILSITICILVLPVGIIGLVLGCVQKDKTSLRNTGIVLNVIGIVLSVLIWCGIAFLAIDVNKSLFSGTFLDNIVEKIKSNANIHMENDDWETYESIRKEVSHGKEKTLIGTWRLLGDEIEYVEVKDETFCTFTDIETREDADCGTYKLANLIDENDIVNKYTNSLKEIIEKNGVYLMKVRFVYDAEEENISLMWVLIDHKEEGIQAIVVNNTDEEDSDDISASFIKIAD